MMETRSVLLQQNWFLMWCVMLLMFMELIFYVLAGFTMRFKARGAALIKCGVTDSSRLFIELHGHCYEYIVFECVCKI